MSMRRSKTEVASGVPEGQSMTDIGTSEAPFGSMMEDVPMPGRTRIVEYLLRTNGKGEMVSMLGPCVCGAGKKEWHAICLKEKSDE